MQCIILELTAEKQKTNISAVLSLIPCEQKQITNKDLENEEKDAANNTKAWERFRMLGLGEGGCLQKSPLDSGCWEQERGATYQLESTEGCSCSLLG